MVQPSQFLHQAMVASLIVSPRSPGLSLEELIELGAEHGLKQGEITDAVQTTRSHSRSPNLLFNIGIFEHFLSSVDVDFQPEFRNLAAMDRVHAFFHERRRELGRNNSAADYDVVVANCATKGLNENDIQVALAILTTGSLYDEREGKVIPNHYTSELISSNKATLRQSPMSSPLVKPLIDRIRILVAKRNAGKPISSEPLEAFRSILTELGHDYFFAWWVGLCSELRRADPSIAPTCVTTISAALAEGALTLIFDLAQSKDLTMTRLRSDDKRRWKFEDLVNAAKTGKAPIIKEDSLAQACMKLNKDRQRIHAGRLLESKAEYPYPDFRPEEARHAKATLDHLVRAIVDWYERNR